MQNYFNLIQVVLILVSCSAIFGGCTHAGKTNAAKPPEAIINLKPLKVDGEVPLRLKADTARPEQVTYLHSSVSLSYEDNQLRHQKEERMGFVTQAETLSSEPGNTSVPNKFTQAITVVKKDGNMDMHDFALPEVGERLEITADSRGKIIRAGDYPTNSIFYVSPISLPEKPVRVGDTWVERANWLSLEEMIPYQLDMVSILRGFWSCGVDTCAEIEISGEVGFQGPLAKTLKFNSTWRGKIYFALNAGTVIWSRTDSQERFMTDNVRRDVTACLEAVLTSPNELRLAGLGEPKCDPAALSATEIAKP